MRLKRFTLIELLALIAMFAMLSTLLLPSIQQARARAKTAVCLSNQKQLFIVTNFFMNNNGGHIPPVTNGSLSTKGLYKDMWNESGVYSGTNKAKYQRYMGFLFDNDKGHFQDNDVVFWRKIKEEDAIYKCPIDTRVIIGETEARQSSYGPNMNLWQHWGNWKSQDPLNVTKIDKPDQAVLMGDRTNGMYIRDWDLGLKDEEYFGYLLIKDSSIVLRHPNKSSAFTYVDGHSKLQYWPMLETTAGN
ncbi:MAG: type II secretion system GspH family protein [Lentisphaeraceae bacterium]|nr:type II secretion system GspH family protein [Lentisphaeraceae bacterium]